MNLKQHANRYYKSLCTCQYPAPSKFARDICAWCGGIIPRYRLLEVEQQAIARADASLALWMVVLILVAVAVAFAFPGCVDGAIANIGR